MPTMKSDPSLATACADYTRVERAIRFLDRRFRHRPALEEIAAHVGLSPFHFHRLFRRWAGVTPDQFRRFLSLEYARELLRESRPVLETSLDAGLSGPARLHDLFVTFEAVTPGDVRRRGKGLRIGFGIHPTPFGECLAAVTARGLCDLRFLPSDDADPDDAVDQLRRDWPRAAVEGQPGMTAPVVEQIFAPGGREHGPPLRLAVHGTNFQVRVWRALLGIPAGTVVSYGALADVAGSSAAVRAAAGAVARNPVAWLIPCHRVIAATGAVHGYRWDPVRKRAMLAWEAGRRAEPGTETDAG